MHAVGILLVFLAKFI